MVNIIRESFPNFDTLLFTLNNREENSIMEGERESARGSYSFTKTESYNEAVHLLRYGYVDILPKVKSLLKEQEKIASELFFIPKTIHYPNVVGFAPHVPNAIAGLPNSMINISRTLRKQKTVSIKYFMGAKWSEDTEYFIQAGIPLISAINIMELNGIQTELSTVFYSGQDDSHYTREVVIADVIIKNFGERFDLQKICFPLAHPSFFRRIGFKYLETCPKLTKYGFRSGYGTVLDKEDILKYTETSKNTQILDVKWIHEHNNSVEEIIKKVGLINGT